MSRSPLTNRIIVGAAFVLMLAALRYQPWQYGGADGLSWRESLTVGFLPVT